MNDSSPAGGAVIELIVAMPKKSLLGAAKVSIPVVQAECQLFEERRGADGQREFVEVMDRAGGSMASEQPLRLYRVNRSRFHDPFHLEGAHRDAQGHDWDLLASRVAWSVRDGLAFLRAGAAALLDEAHPLTRQGALEWLRTRLRAPLADELATRDLEGWRNPVATPIAAWGALFEEVCRPLGVELVPVEQPHLISADAERAEAERRAEAARQKAETAATRERLARQKMAEEDLRQKELLGQLEQDKARHDLDRQGAREQALHESAKRRMQQEAELSEIQFQTQQAAAEQRVALSELDVLQRRKMLELSDLEREERHRQKAHELELENLVRAEQERDKAAQHLEEVAEGKADLEKHLMELQRKIEAWTGRDQQHLEAIHTILDLLRAIARNTTHGHQLAASAATFGGEAGLAPEVLAASGQLGTARFGEWLLSLSGRLPQQVRLREAGHARRDFGARDLLASAGISGEFPASGPLPRVQVDTIRVGSRIRFELSSDRSGYLTLINAGTSGNYFLLAPNIFHASPIIQAGQTYPVPGDSIIPTTIEIEEQGPVGWEFLIAIVTDRSLVTPARLREVPQAGAFYRLPATLMDTLEADLKRLAENQWAVGVLKFLVLPR